jgi:hypothetical protein
MRRVEASPDWNREIGRTYGRQVRGLRKGVQKLANFLEPKWSRSIENLPLCANDKAARVTDTAIIRWLKRAEKLSISKETVEKVRMPDLRHFRIH